MSLFTSLFKTDSLDLNIEDLCNTQTILRGNNFLNMLQQTHSQFYANWFYLLSRKSKETIYLSPLEVTYNQTDLYYGLPLEQAIRACRNMYMYELAKVTVEIADPVVITIQRRVSSTLSEYVGVVGKHMVSAVRLLAPLVGTFKTIFSGGTIGLFTGMSIISMIEALYWMMKVDDDLG